MNTDQKQTKMFKTKLETKDLLIFLLGVGIIFMFFFGSTDETVETRTRLDALEKDNKTYFDRNEKLRKDNERLDKSLAEYDKKFIEINSRISDSDKIIKYLKNKKSENTTYVNSLSGDDVAKSFSNYLEGR